MRRAYISYEMVSLQHSIMGSNQDVSKISSARDNVVPCAVYHFILPSSHPSIVNHSPSSSSGTQTPSINVSSETGEENQLISYGNYRVGLIAAFNTMEHVQV